MDTSLGTQSALLLLQDSAAQQRWAAADGTILGVLGRPEVELLVSRNQPMRGPPLPGRGLWTCSATTHAVTCGWTPFPAQDARPLLPGSARRHMQCTTQHHHVSSWRPAAIAQRTTFLLGTWGSGCGASGWSPNRTPWRLRPGATVAWLPGQHPVHGPAK
jgi:hypothetical protein